MALPLAKRLSDLTQKAGITKAANFHVQLLQVFAESGHSASPNESVQFLQWLRKARDAVSERSAKAPEGPRQVLQKWTTDLTTHEGFAVLKQRLFADRALEALPDDELSRAYNQLRRLNLGQEAGQLWPKVQARFADGRMASARELLGIWSVAPQEHMAEVDARLARALEKGDPKTWQLLSAVSRASEWSESETVVRCAGKLNERLLDLSSDDLALLVAQLSSRFEPGVRPPKALAAVARRAKAELQARGGRLETLQLCGLLGSIESFEDELWPMVRTQLTASTDFSAQQALQVLRFLRQRQVADGLGDQELRREEAQLFGVAVKQLQKLLTTRAQPGLVAMVSKSLDCVVSDFRTCQVLLNAAVKLRTDFYPAVLWRLFVHCGEVDLTSRHPNLKSRLELVAETLEKHGMGNHMALSDMAAVAEAMRRTGVVLKKCIAQMAGECLEVLKKTEAEVGQAARGETDWLGEAQRLALLFWAQLKRLKAEDDSALEEAVLAFSGHGGDCRLDAEALMKAVEELDGVEGAASVRDGLVGRLAAKLPSMSPQTLAETSALASSQALRRAVTDEVVRRLRDIGAVRRGRDFDNLVAILSRWATWMEDERAAARLEDTSTQESLVPLELLQRTTHLVGDSLPAVLEREPEAARRRLVEAVSVLAALAPDGVPLASLRQGLRREAAVGAAWEPAPAAELAFGISALHAGALPFDAALRLWRFMGGVLDAKGSDSLRGPEVAKLWAFGLAARHLSSRTVRAALSMADEAPAMEAFLSQAGKQAKNRFRLSQEVGSSALLDRLRSALPTLFPNMACEERFAVPSTPYVVDLALEDRGLLLVVPRAAHLAAGSRELSGSAQLMERTLEAMGWKLQWIWPEQWSPRLDSLAGSEGKEEALDALRGLLGLGSPGAADGSIGPELQAA